MAVDSMSRLLITSSPAAQTTSPTHMARLISPFDNISVAGSPQHTVAATATVTRGSYLVYTAGHFSRATRANLDGVDREAREVEAHFNAVEPGSAQVMLDASVETLDEKLAHTILIVDEVDDLVIDEEPTTCACYADANCSPGCHCQLPCGGCLTRLSVARLLVA